MELLRRLRAHPHFDQFFVSEELPDDDLIQRSSTRRSFQDDDPRIPFALALKEPPDNGDSPFMESLKSLIFAESWAANMSVFEATLLQWQASSSASGSFASILPGQPFDNEQLSRIQPASVLSQEDQLEVYQKFHECLRLNTREEFLDLLLESLPHFIRAASAYLSCLVDTLFTMASSSLRQVPVTTAPQPRFEPSRSRPISPASEPLTIPLRSVQLPPADIRLCTVLAPPRGVKEQQLVMIKNCISLDSRYHAMDYMSSERQTYLTSHLDILLHRASQTEASPLLPPASTIPGTILAPSWINKTHFKSPSLCPTVQLIRPVGAWIQYLRNSAPARGGVWERRRTVFPATSPAFSDRGLSGCAWRCVQCVRT